MGLDGFVEKSRLRDVDGPQKKRLRGQSNLTNLSKMVKIDLLIKETVIPDRVNFGLLQHYPVISLHASRRIRPKHSASIPCLRLLLSQYSSRFIPPVISLLPPSSSRSFKGSLLHFCSLAAILTPPCSHWISFQESICPVQFQRHLLMSSLILLMSVILIDR